MDRKNYQETLLSPKQPPRKTYLEALLTTSKSNFSLNEDDYSDCDAEEETDNELGSNGLWQDFATFNPKSFSKVGHGVGQSYDKIARHPELGDALYFYMQNYRENIDVIHAYTCLREVTLYLCYERGMFIYDLKVEGCPTCELWDDYSDSGVYRTKKEWLAKVGVKFPWLCNQDLWIINIIN